VAGDGERGHRDGAAAQARCNCPNGLALLPDGRVLVSDQNTFLLNRLPALTHSSLGFEPLGVVIR
jgi:hypothetical protein